MAQVIPFAEKRRCVAARVESHGRYLIQDHKNLDMLAIPGGKFEPGEEPEIALLRELYEELGVTRVKIKSLDIMYSEAIDMVCYVYDVELRDRPRNMEPEKHRFQEFMTTKEILESQREISEVTKMALDML